MLGVCTWWDECFDFSFCNYIFIWICFPVLMLRFVVPRLVLICLHQMFRFVAPKETVALPRVGSVYLLG